MLEDYWALVFKMQSAFSLPVSGAVNVRVEKTVDFSQKFSFQSPSKRSGKC